MQFGQNFRIKNIYNPTKGSVLMCSLNYIIDEGNLKWFPVVKDFSS